jgi:thiamine-monophosphate kinase
MAGEFDLIHWIRTQTARHEHVLVPPGDDLAVLKWPADELLIVGVDQVLDGVHFDSAVHAPADIGRKVMNRNLSDCAAMACLPAAAVATVALPKSRGLEYAKELFVGMKAAADAFDFPIVGGDTASWDAPLAMTVSILGRSAGVTPIRRGGARPGNFIYVTGELGGSILGRHMTFTPRVNEARQLAATGLVTSMIDLSDGLSRDLRHLCRESGNLGALLSSDSIPIHEDAERLSRQTVKFPIEHALHDGEDYELLFTTSAEQPFGYHIGMMTADGVIRDVNEKVSLEPRGWEHQL